MKRLFAAFAMTILLAGCASPGPGRDRGQRSFGKPVANPSAIVQAELAFARLAREKGQWTAFRETATDDAVMFVPNLTNAQQWLKGKADPAQAVDWQPHKIYMSCDGSMAVSTGAWQAANGNTGKFYTIWQRQNATQRQRARGEGWKWVFDHGFAVDTPLEEPDFVETKVASCKERPKPAPRIVSLAVDEKFGVSADNTMNWNAWQEKDDGSRHVTVNTWDGEKFNTVIDEKFGSPDK